MNPSATNVFTMVPTLPSVVERKIPEMLCLGDEFEVGAIDFENFQSDETPMMTSTVTDIGAPELLGGNLELQPMTSYNIEVSSEILPTTSLVEAPATSLVIVNLPVLDTVNAELVGDNLLTYISEPQTVQEELPVIMNIVNTELTSSGHDIQVSPQEYEVFPSEIVPGPSHALPIVVPEDSSADLLENRHATEVVYHQEAVAGPSQAECITFNNMKLMPIHGSLVPDHIKRSLRRRAARSQQAANMARSSKVGIKTATKRVAKVRKPIPSSEVQLSDGTSLLILGDPSNPSAVYVQEDSPEKIINQNVMVVQRPNAPACVVPVVPVEPVETERKKRVVFTKAQKERLLEEFEKYKESAPSPVTYRIAMDLGLAHSEVKNWFMNHRAKLKRCEE